MDKELAQSHLDTLKSLLSWFGSSTIRSSIRDVEEIIAEQKNLCIKFETICEPFFIAYEQDQKKYRVVTLQLFNDIFTKSNLVIFPTSKLTSKALKIIFNLNDVDDIAEYEQKLDLLVKIFGKASSKYYIHGKEIYDTFVFLLQLYNKLIGNELERKCEEIIDWVLKCVFEDEKLVFPHYNNKNLSTFVTRLVTRNALILSKVIPNSKNVTILDADLVVIIEAISKIIEGSKLNTILLSCNLLNKILSGDYKLFKSNYFEILLNQKIHLILMSLVFNSDIKTVDIFLKLLLLVWKRFSHLYQKGLYDLFENGLLVALSSPNIFQVKKTFNIFQKLSSETQLFVDLFVNYDCVSTQYQSVFENIILKISKFSYPDKIHSVLGLNTLQMIISSMWNYLNNNYNIKDSSSDIFIKAKHQKSVFLQGVDLFKKSPKKGLNFFIENKFAEQSHISEFLFKTPQLDPTAVGEVIGTEGNSEILKGYLSCFNFTGKSFESAFREFLSKFRIPGESQMIDRIMEQFGAKYYNDNPTLFSAADTVYVLAFSALMLHTDAHHPTLKNRMTLEQFIANNKGIDGGKDLPRELLVDLYNGITSKRIYLTSQDSDPTLLTRQQRVEIYQQKCKKILNDIKITNVNNSGQSNFQRIVSANVISPMFQAICDSVFAVFTISFDAKDDKEIIDYCLKGLSDSTNIAAHCYMEDCLSILINSFTKFTKLRTYSFETIKSKNIECIRSLLKVVKDNMLYLRNSWTILMDEISAIEKLGYFEIPDILFTESSKYDRESITDFVQAICTASSHEIKEAPPRMYLLLKLVDVSFFNMGRPKIIWQEIWSIISKYLIEKGSSENKVLAETTLNVLWQITSEFMKKTEVQSYHFQENFLRTFFEIFLAQNSMEVKGLIFECVERLVNDFSETLQSGWNVIFQILTECTIGFRQKGYSLLKPIIEKHLKSLSTSQISHLTTVLTFFILKGNEEDIILDSFNQLKYISQHILTLKDSIETTQLWDCFFASLQQCKRHSNKKVQKLTCETINEILQNEKIPKQVQDKIPKE